MDVSNTDAMELQRPKKSKWLLYVGVTLAGATMLIWSVVLPILGIVYVVKLFN